MNNTLIYLYGFPGTGKLTIAKKICEKADVKLIDNHLICNPVFSLIESDGKTPLPGEVWKNVRKIREVVLDTLANLSPQTKSFVLTNVLTQNDPEDLAIFQKVQNVARQRDAKFIPVRLLCDEDENLKRIVSPERIRNMKFLKPDGLKRVRKENDVLKSGHKDEFTLDVTNITPEESADTILKRVKTL